MTEGNAMFHITLITVGKLKERYYAAAADEYIRRLGAYCKFELIELPECRLPDDPNFLIGSSFGIDARIKRMADFRLSFSKMTFPHHLMRVMALEQLYRAESILAGTRYHK